MPYPSNRGRQFKFIERHDRERDKETQPKRNFHSYTTFVYVSSKTKVCQEYAGESSPQLCSAGISDPRQTRLHRVVPSFSIEPVRIYLDIEGIPERRFNYLIGALVCTETSMVHHSFWADNPSQEIEIFRSFLDLVSSFDRFRVFHYGAYETTVLKRMRSLVQPSESIDRVLAHSTTFCH